MNNTLVMLLTDLIDRYEVLVQPFDGRWQAIVTDYGFSSDEGGVVGDKRKVRAVGSSAAEALQKALLAVRA